MQPDARRSWADVDRFERLMQVGRDPRADVDREVAHSHKILAAAAKEDNGLVSLALLDCMRTGLRCVVDRLPGAPSSVES